MANWQVKSAFIFTGFEYCHQWFIKTFSKIQLQVATELTPDVIRLYISKLPGLFGFR